jgi:hypothetical protein
MIERGWRRGPLRAYAQLGLAFEEAATAVDLAVVLPTAERESPVAAAAVASARETLTRLGAMPFLNRLETGREGSPVASVRPARSSASIDGARRVSRGR